MGLTTPEGKKAITAEEKYKAEAELFEKKRIDGLGVWKDRIIKLRIGEAEERFAQDQDRIEKSVKAITSAQAIVSELKSRHWNFQDDEAQRILDGDAEQREAVSQFRTGNPKIKPKFD